MTSTVTTTYEGTTTEGDPFRVQVAGDRAQVDIEVGGLPFEYAVSQAAAILTEVGLGDMALLGNAITPTTGYDWTLVYRATD